MSLVRCRRQSFLKNQQQLEIKQHIMLWHCWHISCSDRYLLEGKILLQAAQKISSGGDCQFYAASCNGEQGLEL